MGYINLYDVINLKLYLKNFLKVNKLPESILRVEYNLAFSAPTIVTF